MDIGQKLQNVDTHVTLDGVELHVAMSSTMIHVHLIQINQIILMM